MSSGEIRPHDGGIKTELWNRKRCLDGICWRKGINIVPSRKWPEEIEHVNHSTRSLFNFKSTTNIHWKYYHIKWEFLFMLTSSSFSCCLICVCTRPVFVISRNPEGIKLTFYLWKRDLRAMWKILRCVYVFTTIVLRIVSVKTTLWNLHQ